MMTLDKINNASEDDAKALFLSCCTASRWIERMTAGRPYADTEALFDAANRHWQDLGESDFLEAFDGHPKIGDPDSLKAKYAHTKGLASGEQSSVQQASDETIMALADYNQRYLDKFGFIFIVFATGKSAQQMLDLLKGRFDNNRATELANAAEEQRKIFHKRLENLL